MQSSFKKHLLGFFIFFVGMGLVHSSSFFYKGYNLRYSVVLFARSKCVSSFSTVNACVYQYQLTKYDCPQQFILQRWAVSQSYRKLSKKIFKPSITSNQSFFKMLWILWMWIRPLNRTIRKRFHTPAHESWRS